MQYGTVDPATCQAVSYCLQATPLKTNADRIRTMTDEELAEFISNQIIDRNIGVPIEAWLNWLKESAI